MRAAPWCIEGNDGDNEIKLPAGSLVLYPTTTLHHVSEVTSGERLAIVGWVRSYIRSHEEPRDAVRSGKRHLKPQARQCRPRHS